MLTQLPPVELYPIISDFENHQVALKEYNIEVYSLLYIWSQAQIFLLIVFSIFYPPIRLA